MPGLYIAAVVLVLIALILAGRITVILDYNGELYLKISYLFITIFSIPPKSRKSAKKDSKVKQTAKKTEDDAKKDADKLKLKDIFELVKLVANSLSKPLKKCLKRTVISHLRLDIVCGGDDAAKAALNYGKTSILVGNALGWIDDFFTLKSTDGVNIGVDFACEDTKTAVYCEIRLSLAAAIAFAVTFFGRAANYSAKNKDAKKALNKVLGK